TFLTIKTSKKRLNEELERLVDKKIIIKIKVPKENCFRYTVGEYSIKSKINLPTGEKNDNLKFKIKNFKKRHLASEKKLKNWRFRLYIKLLSFFSQIKFVGLSGSLAMMSAKKDDDIDLFIITAKNRLFTGRFLALIFAYLIGLKRKKGVFKAPNKVCLNLFFDESDLQVPKFKQTEYVAHEVLQMRPIISKDNTYQRFLTANQWVFKLFPNALTVLKLKIKNLKFSKNYKFKIENFGDWVENLLKKFQLSLINKHRTSEIITDSQLWFHPVDFEKKIRSLS
ncbi:MAG: hypothetical protein N2593_00580, partial [Patescibacteria group bacterium]|nr:hypothetical protein [Patescibacteria group bacterium]